MGGAEACLIRQGIERGLVAPVFGNESQRVFDQFVVVRLLFHDPNLVPLSAGNHPFLAQGFARLLAERMRQSNVGAILIGEVMQLADCQMRIYQRRF